MGVHERSAAERPGDEAAPSSPQTESTQAADLLAHASCLQCGYPLRGLTENRCPECGTTFDPEDMADTYPPEWPRLIVWYLTAACLTGLFQLLFQVLWTLSAEQPISSLIQDQQALVFLFDFATMILIAPWAIMGLVRRLDWGRKIVIGLCMVQSIPLLPVFFMMVFNLVSAGRDDVLNVEVVIWYLLPLWKVASQLSLPSLVVAGVLWTRLGRRSLRRKGSDEPLMLPRKVFPPRNDWLLMLVVLLAVGARTHLGYLGEMALRLIWLFTIHSDFGTPWWEEVASTASWTALLVAQLGWLAWIAREIWRNPASTRRRLRLFVIVFIASVIADEIKDLLVRETDSFSSLGTAVCHISSILAYVLACLSIPLALCLYASRALPDEAIARVVVPQPQAAGPRGFPLADR